ncbi:hypothetical protein AB0873_31235 [Micromonospora sp. NPDC047707]|uniref:hypothetical protein n=1 Tax=unclassified Micromonospora TaxID=2617518 RepID=UPI0012B4C4F8|nr:hypothetical protein [Micromonospora sp. WMMC415]QGN45626.1 hypothetical protein GKC29_01310 [Micromonospora sp. WMMC415]
MNLTRIKSAAAIGSLATALLLVPSAPAQAASCANGTQTDIGYTILSGGYIKGSASYTSCPDRPISRAEIWIRRNGGRLFATEVEIKRIATPSSRSFSPKDRICQNRSVTSRYDTFVVFHHSDGGKTELRSNSITVRCE